MENEYFLRALDARFEQSKKTMTDLFRKAEASLESKVELLFAEERERNRWFPIRWWKAIRKKKTKVKAEAGARERMEANKEKINQMRATYLNQAKGLLDREDPEALPEED